MDTWTVNGCGPDCVRYILYSQGDALLTSNRRASQMSRWVVMTTVLMHDLCPPAKWNGTAMGGNPPTAFHSS
ncbi:hypothetical protein AALO_G00051180 [Alosa alosa]|uniref:Uncharacterized protein n=1 Tax=Alosa alosa TaxID=278164 RepID=A0AAV6H3W3_9TELE|nr:hypothetical protein AALO_G00051180 [Alosa alosa]